MRVVLIIVIALLWAMPAQAQLWNGYLTPTTTANGRGIDWTGMLFIPPDTTTWTQCGITVTTSTAVGTINGTISGCGQNTFVLFGAGTFNLNGNLNLNGKKNFVLRGSGTTSTIINNTAQGGCTNTSVAVCVEGAGGNFINDGAAGHIPSTTITAGVAPGATVLTVASTTNLSAGQVVWVTQNDEDNFAIYAPFVAGAPYNPGGTPVGHVQDRGTAQGVRILSVNSGANQITLERGLYYTRWSQTRSPILYYFPTGATTSKNVGIENMTIKRNGAPGGGPNSVIEANGVDGFWVKNVAIHFCFNYCIGLFSTTRVAISNSYLFQHPLDNNLSNRYGVVTCCGATDTAVYNTICQEMQACIMGNGAAPGAIIAYNFARNQPWNGTTSGGPVSNNSAIYPTHSLGMMYWLIEGNDVNAITFDDDHGTGCCDVVVRNLLKGPDFDQTNPTVQRNNPIIDQSYQRWMSFFGNVLGTPGVTTNYQTHPGATIGNPANWNVIYAMGASVDESAPTDNTVWTSSLRYGNYDTATGTVRFQSSEIPADQVVPSGGFANVVPNSFYLTSKPSWFGSVNFPPIGPEVTTGTISGYGGRANRIPARKCYEDVMGGPANGYTGTTPLTFDPVTCYPTSGPDITPPAAPQNLRISERPMSEWNTYLVSER